MLAKIAAKFSQDCGQLFLRLVYIFASDGIAKTKASDSEAEDSDKSF